MQNCTRHGATALSCNVVSGAPSGKRLRLGLLKREGDCHMWLLDRWAGGPVNRC